MPTSMGFHNNIQKCFVQKSEKYFSWNEFKPIFAQNTSTNF